MEKNQDQPFENSTNQLLDMISAQRARRTMLKGAVAGVAALSALGTNAFVRSGNVFAHSKPHTSKFQKILDIAVTTERLAVTTYCAGIANAKLLGIKDDDLLYLEAAIVEEQIHEFFFESLGGVPLTSTFSYPSGATTFTDLTTFINTQQTLEDSFDSAFLAGVIEVAQAGEFRLAQILAQIACIEAEHRVLGRVIGCKIIGYQPADNRAYTPVLVKKVEGALDVLTEAGYLSPTIGNMYTYVPVSTDFPDIEYRTPYSVGHPNNQL